MESQRTEKACPNISSCRQVGFSSVTRVCVRDLFQQRDLGVATGHFTSGTIAPAGVQMLRLSLADDF